MVWDDLVLSTVESLAYYENDIEEFGEEVINDKISLAKHIIESRLSSSVDNIDDVADQGDVLKESSDLKTLAFIYFDRSSNINDKWWIKFNHYDKAYDESIKRAEKRIIVNNRYLVPRQGRVFR